MSRASVRALLVLVARQGVLLVVILARRWGRGTRLDSTARRDELWLAREG